MLFENHVDELYILRYHVDTEENTKYTLRRIIIYVLYVEVN